MPGNEAFLRPDVYTFEEEVGAAPFQPSGTSAAGFVDVATWGPIGKPVLITSPEQFYRTFGADFSVSYLAQAVTNFFRVGGRRCYIVRTAHYTDITDPLSYTATKATVTIDDGGQSPQNVLRVDAKYPGTRGNNLWIQIDNVDSTAKTFDLFVLDKRAYGYLVLERYTNLSVDETAPNFVEYRINANPDKLWRGSDYIEVTYVFTGTEGGLPKEGTFQLTGGTNGETSIQARDYVGNAAAHNGVYAFDLIDEIVNINHPGITDPDVIVGALNYVYNHPYTKPPRTNLYVYDIPLGYTPQEAQQFIRDQVMMTTGYEAVYYPWLKVENRYEPAAPYMLGVFAQNDLYVGVWNAPAGTDYPLPVTGLAYECTLGDQEVLNPIGINCIVKQDYWGIVPWGARTLRVETRFRYLQVRRFVNLLKKELYQVGKQFVFKMNAPKVWARIQETAEMMLAYYYSLGAFGGKTREASYYAKCDASTNPPELVEQGICVCEIGIVPVKPIEFLVFNVLLYPEGALPNAAAMSVLTD